LQSGKGIEPCHFPKLNSAAERRLVIHSRGSGDQVNVNAQQRAETSFTTYEEKVKLTCSRVTRSAVEFEFWQIASTVASMEGSKACHDRRQHGEFSIPVFSLSYLIRIVAAPFLFFRLSGDQFGRCAQRQHYASENS
jgi:hypothetical protein